MFSSAGQIRRVEIHAFADASDRAIGIAVSFVGVCTSKIGSKTSYNDSQTRTVRCSSRSQSREMDYPRAQVRCGRSRLLH